MPIRLPSVTVNIIPAFEQPQNATQKVLFVGQMTSSGTATPGQLYESLDNANGQDTLFGKNSMLAAMVRSAKEINKISRMDAIPLADYQHSVFTDTQTFLSGTGFSYNASDTEFSSSRMQQKIHSPETYTQTFLDDTGFTYNSSDTEFSSSRMQQVDQGGDSYLGDVISVPVYTAATVVSYATFTAVDDGTIRYTVDGQYWTGTAWAASNNTWAQSSIATDIAAHISTLVPTGTNITIKIITNDGSVQMWVSSVVITYNVTSSLYIGDVISVPVYTASPIVSYANFVSTDDGTIQYILDGKYWTGSAWATSNNTWAQSNTASDIAAHIATLTPVGTNITLKVVTNSGSSQMWVSSVVITYYKSSNALPASGAVVFSGTATETGTIIVSIGSSINHSYEISVASTDTSEVIGDALVDAITNDDTSPVTAINTSGSVAITAVNNGLEGNFIGLSYSGAVAGITTTLTAMSGGSTNPSLTNIFDVIGAQRYQTIVWPESYTLSTVVNFLNSRFNVDNNILDGVAIICATGSASSLSSTYDSENSQSLAVIGNKAISSDTQKGSGILELDYVIASEFAAIRSLRLSPDANISNYVITNNGAKDGYGGPAIASLPYFNTPFYNLPTITSVYEFTDTEVTQLNAAGVSVVGNNIDNNQIISGEILTTYKTDVAGNQDVSFKYLEYVDTISNVREYISNGLRSRFSQSRLTDGDVIPYRNMANKAVVSATLDGLYNDLSGSDYVLLRAGPEAFALFNNSKIIDLDLANGKVTISFVAPIVTQTRIINVSMQMSFALTA
jgi:phage tail sheath gpL-like